MFIPSNFDSPSFEFQTLSEIEAGKIQNLQKAQEGVKKAQNLLDVMETKAKDKQNADFEGSQGKKILEKKLARALKTIEKQKVKIESKNQQKSMILGGALLLAVFLGQILLNQTSIDDFKIEIQKANDIIIEQLINQTTNEAFKIQIQNFEDKLESLVHESKNVEPQETFGFFMFTLGICVFGLFLILTLKCVIQRLGYGQNANKNEGLNKKKQTIARDLTEKNQTLLRMGKFGSP